MVVTPTAEWGSSDQDLTPLGAEHRTGIAPPLSFSGPQTVLHPAQTLKERHSTWGWRWLTKDPCSVHRSL